MNSTYSRISTSNDSCDLEEKIEPMRLARPSWWQRYSLYAWLLSCLAWFFTMALLYGRLTRIFTDEECSKQISGWSPALEAIEIQSRQFQNTFFEPSQYRGTPTVEVEQAWLDLWNVGVFDIPLEALPLLNKSTSRDWHMTPAHLGNGVVGNLEVFHHLHCLDTIRQYTYLDAWDYSHHPVFDAPAKLVREHVDHCINSLRMVLMCQADVTPFLQINAHDKPLGSEPDFNVQHKCRNFDRIHGWATKNRLNVPLSHVD